MFLQVLWLFVDFRPPVKKISSTNSTFSKTGNLTILQKTGADKWWRSVRKSLAHLGYEINIYKNNMKLKLGNMDQISFTNIRGFCETKKPRNQQSLNPRNNTKTRNPKPRSQETKKPRKQETNKPRNQATKNPQKPKNQEAKKPRNQETKTPRNLFFSSKGIRSEITFAGPSAWRRRGRRIWVWICWDPHTSLQFSGWQDFLDLVKIHNTNFTGLADFPNLWC